MTTPKIKYDIEAEAKGEASVEALAKSLDDLGQTLDGDLKQHATAAADALRSLGEKQAAVAAFQQIQNASSSLAVELAEAATSVRQIETQLGTASAATQKFSVAELQAKAALESTKTQLAAARTGYAELQAATVGSARGSVEYKAATEQLRTSIQQLAADTRVQKIALKEAATESRSAQAAENGLSAQYEKSASALRRVQGELRDNSAALDASRAVLNATGIEAVNLAQAERNLGAAVAAVRQQVSGMAPVYAQVAAASASAAKQQVGDQKSVSDGVASIRSQLQQIQQIAVVALGGGFVGSMLKDVTATADAYNNLAARIKLVTGEGAAFTAGFEGVQRVALGTNSALENTGTLFSRILQAGKEFNLAQDDALKLTQSVNQAVQLASSSAQASDAAITQLIQGLQSGVLRGEEFNSVMEQAPRLAIALADGLGVTTGELRKMAQAGELTTATVIKALQSQSQALQAEFEKMPATVGRAITNLQTQWSLFVGQLDSSTGATSYVAAGINKLADNLDTVARIATLAGAALTASLAVQGVTALRAYAAEAALAAGATNLLTASINKVPKTINIVVAVTGFELGYQLGTLLYDNSELARKLGAGIVGYFAIVVNSLRLAKEAAAAVFTSDTVDAAFDRYMERNREVRESIQAMMVDAEQAPQRVGAAVDAATAQTGQLGAAAQSAGAQVAQAGAVGAAGMGGMGKAASDTLSIFKGLLAEAQKPPPKQGAVEGIAAQLVDARKKGLDLDALLRRELPDAITKLSGPELAKFRQDFIKAMQDAGGAGKEVQTGLRLIGEQAARSLGVDLAAASNQVSDSFRQADEAMRVLILSMPALKAAGVDTGQVVGQALAKMIDGAKTQSEIEAVRQRVQALRGDLGGGVADGLLDQAAAKARELKTALEDATPGINGVAEAMRRLGVVSDESLRDTAKTSRESYEAMVASGTASARELGAGFRRAAEEAIAANNGIAPSWVAAQAGARGYRVEVDDAGKSSLLATDKMAKGWNGVGDAAHGAGRAATEAAAANLKALEEINDRHRLGKFKSTVGESGDVREATVMQYDINQDIAKRYGDDMVGNTLAQQAWQLRQQLQSYQRNYGGARSKQSLSQQRNIAAELDRLEAEIEATRKKPNGGEPPSASAPSAPPSPASPSVVQQPQKGVDRIVNIYIGTNAQPHVVPTNATGENSINRLANEFIGLLEDAKSRSASAR